MPLTRLDIRSRVPFPIPGVDRQYERIDGIAHFATDPAHEANAEICDIDLAQRGPDALVHFDADFCILRPIDGGTRRLLFDVANRGGKIAMVYINRAVRPLVPTPEIDPGDGFLFANGWTVAWCGWQWDVPDHEAFLGLRAPDVVGDDGQPIAGTVRVQVSCNQPRMSAGLKDESLGPSLFRAYRAADLGEPGATLYVRDYQEAPAVALPRERWRFGRTSDDGAFTPSDSHVTLDGGFEPGKVYDLHYTTKTCPLVGAGLIAVREFVAHLRSASDPAANPCAGQVDATYGFGVSQSGRFLRTFLYHGQNIAEDGRQVFDGVMPVIAGGRRGEFNIRYGQPSVEITHGAGFLPPFHDDGLLERQRARRGGVPKIMNVNSASEYWRGDGSVFHTSRDGTADVPLAPESRAYMVAGTQHGPGMLPFMRTNPLSGAVAMHPFNVVDSRLVVRAAIENLHAWARAAIEPPPSAIPSVAEGTAIDRRTALDKLPAIPGMTTPDPATLFTVQAIGRGEDGTWNATGDPANSLVSALDADGNEVAGIRLPDITVPVGTHAGWNTRDPQTGGDRQVMRLVGSTFPFPRDEDEREATGDPRPSLAERYRNRDDYALRVREAAEKLAAQRLIWPGDVDLAVENCMARWDAVLAGVRL